VSGAAIIVDDVSKKFRLFKERNNSIKAALLRGHRAISEDFWALDHVSFEVAEGSTVGLIGENGSGKSTMLKCVAKILRPDTGGIAVEGKMSALLELGSGFHPELSGRENVFLNGSILGLSGKEVARRFDEIVEFSGIGKFIDEPVKNYSSGMYVRLGFSVAINVEPDVLLVDEVLAVGDENFQRKCLEKFAQLRRDGKTIVIVSHSMSAVINICDHVVWFEHGKKVGDGHPRDVVQAYAQTAQVDRKPTEVGERWGSGEATIDKVEVLDRSGAPVNKLLSGQPATIRLHYNAAEPVARPVFGVTFETLNGMVVSGPTTRETDDVPEKIDGRGCVDLVLPELRILPGTYDVSASLTDYTVSHPYDIRRHILRVDVEADGPVTPSGVAGLGGHWALSPEG
jgi:ABC-2 type transport system ATP-binding protein